MAQSILIVDDEREIVSMLNQYFCKIGYVVYTAINGKEALNAITKHPDIILLDINMPDMNGFTICEKIRNFVSCPIIFLTARIEDCDKIKGFAVGGDDYVVKPFSPKELMARVNAVLSRKKASTPAAQEIMKFDGLEINIPARTVTVDGNKVELPPKEYELLFYLVKNKNIALSRDKLLSDIRGNDFFGDDRTIDTHIKNLRNNLGPYRDFIVTLRGVGYKFEYEN